MSIRHPVFHDVHLSDVSLQLLGYCGQSGHIVERTIGSVPPRIPHDLSSLIQSIPDSRRERYLSMLLNTHFKCDLCGTVASEPASNCPECSSPLDLSDPIHTVNHFIAYAIGLGRSDGPLTISIRAQSSSFIVFDSPLAFSSAHLTAIPTTIHVPSLPCLISNPPRALALLSTLRTALLSTLRDEFVRCDTFVSSIMCGDAATRLRDAFGGAPSTLTPNIPDRLVSTEWESSAAACPFVVLGISSPSPTRQLAVHAILLPLLPRRTAQLQRGTSFGHGTWYPLEYVTRVLAAAEAASEVGFVTRGDAARPATNDDFVGMGRQLGVDYDDVHADAVASMAVATVSCGRWRSSDFSHVVVGGVGSVPAMCDGALIDKSALAQTPLGSDDARGAARHDIAVTRTPLPSAVSHQLPPLLGGAVMTSAYSGAPPRDGTVGVAVALADGVPLASDAEVIALQRADVLALQNYGRPYVPRERPSGTPPDVPGGAAYSSGTGKPQADVPSGVYYAYARDLDEIEAWA